MFGEEEEDLSDDLSGLPFERRMGVDEVREKDGLGDEVVIGKGTLACCGTGLERGEVRGKGTE
jgi:hypothetical protein